MSSRVRIVAIGAVALVALMLPSSAFGDADLSISLSANPSSIPLGGPETTEITLAVTNAGPDAAADVTAGSTVGLPQLNFTGFVSISQGSAVFSGADPPVSANFGSIPSGATATLRFVLNDAQSGLGTITASTATSTPESSTANNTASATVDVTGLVPDANSLFFGHQVIGGIGPPKTLTVTNRAAIPVQVSNLQIAGADFVTSADGCSGMTLAVDASCQVATRFAPSALGDLSGALTVVSSLGSVSPIEVALAGTGTSLDITPPSFQLAGVPKSMSAKKFRKGFPIRMTSNEPAALEVDLQGTPRRGALASAFELGLFRRSLPLAGGTRSLRVKPRGKLVGPIRRRFKVRLKVVATDAAGNRSPEVARIITVKPSARKKRR